MLEKNWKIDFFIEGKFVTILNYPIYLCPTCANMTIGKNINQKVLDKLSEKTRNRISIPSAIKFEEHF